MQELRKQRGWSQAAASERIGVHWTYLGHLERAEKPGVSLMSIARVANALGVTLSEMFAGLENGDTSIPAGRPLRDPDKLIRVGKNAIKIERLIEEMRLERATLKETVRELKRITSTQSTQGRVRTSTTKRPPRSKKSDKR